MTLLKFMSKAIKLLLTELVGQCRNIFSGGGITCICRDREMCHYFGYFLGTFLDYSRIFGHHFFGKI